MSVATVAPIHPGEVLMEDFIEGFGITQHKLAVAMLSGIVPLMTVEVARINSV